MPRKKKSNSAEAGGSEAVESVATAAPKVEAVVKPKAKASVPTPAPVAVAESKAKAKAKADAKAKVEPTPTSSETVPKAKADSKAGGQAKAAPKAKGEAKAKAEASAKAEPKAKADNSAKAKAKETPASVAPVVEAAAAADSMEVVKSRRRKKKKAEELPPEEDFVMENVGPSTPSPEETAEQARIKNEHDSKNKFLSETFRTQLNSLPSLNNKPRDQVLKEVAEQKKALGNIMSEIDDTLKTVKLPRPKNMNIGSIMQQLRDLKLCKTSFDFSETTRQHMQTDMEIALSQALAFESFRAFQAEMTVIKEECQARLAANEAAAKSVKSKDNQRRILAQVAEVKGVKAEELDEKQVVNTNVDLPPEVTSLQFLFKRKFETQYGVIIDRPEGAQNGGGKGSAGPPPKSLVVRGLQSEVSACAEALRALNFTEKKVVNVTSKQALAVFGPQQANARKLEDDYKGVFVHREANQTQTGQSSFALYGPPKQVAACLKEIQGMMEEEPASAGTSAIIMNIEKGFAKCLIGEKGKTVGNLQTKTGTTINVMNHQSKEDDSPAVVRITGPPEGQEKARAEINAFLSTLTSTLVEAEPEVVARLYDSATVRGKGKGKGRKPDKGAGKGDSKFAELWNSSGLTCLKKAKGIQLVGDKTEVKKWKAVLEECLKEAGTLPLAVKLGFEQGRLWSQERLDALRDSSGAQKVQKASSGKGEISIEISGTDEAKEKAQSMIQEMIDKLSNTETIEGVSDKAQKSLTAKGAGRLREVEQRFDVSVVIDRKAQSVKIMGEPDAVLGAKKNLEELLAVVTKDIEIEWDEGRVVIGVRGQTVNHIKQQCGVETLQVEEDEERKKVILRGSQEAVDAAEQMIKELLQVHKSKAAAKEASAKDIEGKAAEDGGIIAATKPAKEVSPPPKKKPAAEKDTSETGKRQSSVQKERDMRSNGKKGSTKVDIDVSKMQESFPTLGGQAEKQGKRQPQNSAWNRVEGEDNAEYDATEEPCTDAIEVEKEAPEEGA
jgi:hypothetical protein